MELKRILARDTRSATEKALSLYGPDVLIISNHQVDGQTELVVALDVPEEEPAAPAAVVAAPASVPEAPSTPASTAPSLPASVPSSILAQPVQAAQADFRSSFLQAQQPVATTAARAEKTVPVAVPASLLATVQAKATPAEIIIPVLAPAPSPVAMPAAAAFAGAVPKAAAPDPALTEVTGQALIAQAAAEQERELQRSREIVELVRGELAALRREFRLSQQASAWQGGLQVHPDLNPLVEALNECSVPATLRVLLMDALKDQTQPAQALALWREQLGHHLARKHQPLPTKGVHVLAGPSGAGKTLMCARLAAHASALHGTENLAIISYRDQRAGAWSQVQMLGAQMGIDCFRANDEESLRLLLSELSPRTLVVVDTPGVQMAERVSEVQAQWPKAKIHAVVPADASGVTLRKVLVEPGLAWHSVMLSKLDETHAPWAALQLFSDNTFELSCASHGTRMGDLTSNFSLSDLIDLALAPMAAAVEQAAQADEPIVKPVKARASRKAATPRTRTKTTAAAKNA